jgi:hypothetical protein
MRGAPPRAARDGPRLVIATLFRFVFEIPDQGAGGRRDTAWSRQAATSSSPVALKST